MTRGRKKGGKTHDGQTETNIPSGRRTRSLLSTYYRKFACVSLSLSLSLSARSRRTTRGRKKGRKTHTITLYIQKKLFSLEWKRACRVPREDLGSSPSLGGTTTGWPPVSVRPWDLAARCVLILAPTGKWWVLPRATSRWWQVAA
jgi:hypothetical protein